MKKQLTGIVKSAKMIGSATVTVTRTKTHPLYNKKTKVSKSFMCDNTIGAKEGDKVVIEQTRPLSARKFFRIIKIAK